jgi:hypothetical protein
VRTWLFRHRLRLRAVYSPRPALPPALVRLRSGRGPVFVERLGPHTILRVPRKPAA